MYASRVRLLERLAAKGIPLRLYGGGFPRWLGETPIRAAHAGRCITRDEKARVFRSAAGVLNTMHLSEVAGVNARLFEAAGCGAAVLTDFRPTVPDLFAVGDEVLVFHDFDSLVDQATRLLEETGLTGRLGDAAARRAHRDHTYDLRVAEILEKLVVDCSAPRNCERLQRSRHAPSGLLFVLLLFATLVGGETDWSAFLGAIPAISFRLAPVDRHPSSGPSGGYDRDGAAPRAVAGARRRH